MWVKFNNNDDDDGDDNVEIFGEKKTREKLGDIKDFLPKNNKETHNLY